MTCDCIASEDDLLAIISRAFPQCHPLLALGRGDDCAEMLCPPAMVVSTDLFVEDVHFRTRYFTPEEIGYKAMAVNISDMAAAGAQPLGVSVGLAAPVPLERQTAEGIIAGMARAAEEFAIALTGGDLSRGDKLTFCVTIWGGHGSDSNASAPFLRRGPVTPGDALFLCGAIGLARAGLLLLEAEGRSALAHFPLACAAHLRPDPLVAAGLALATIPNCRLMDVSDGMLRDLPRLLAAWGPRRGAVITLAEQDLPPEAVAVARANGEDPVFFAFRGGEDYALLGACPAQALPETRARVARSCPSLPFLHLGFVTEDSGITLNGRLLSYSGFDHFAA